MSQANKAYMPKAKQSTPSPVLTPLSVLAPTILRGVGHGDPETYRVGPQQ